jgi:hypothetical protein
MEKTHGTEVERLVRFGDDDRRAWLRVGGFIAGADGLSESEAMSLAAAAASKDIGPEEVARLLSEGASLTSASAADIATLRAEDESIRYECLIETACAVGADGFSGREWVRFVAVTAEVVAETKVDAFLRYYHAEVAARAARSQLISG